MLNHGSYRWTFRVRKVLKSPWILGKVIEFHFSLKKVLKCLCKFLKILEFSSTLNVVAWKVFFNAFCLPRQNMTHSSEKLKVIYIKRLVLYNQFKTSELIYACLKANSQIYIWWTNHQNDMQVFDPKLWILTLYFNFSRQLWSPSSYLLFWGVSLACFYSFSWEAGEG